MCLPQLACQSTDICRPDFQEAHPLLVIFHDPPSVQAIADPVAGTRDSHNTWLVSNNTVLRCLSLTLHAKTDATKNYVDWAVNNGFQVIDVSIPRIVSVEDVRGAQAGCLTNH